MVIMVLCMINTPMIGNAHMDSRIMENVNQWTLSQEPLVEKRDRSGSYGKPMNEPYDGSSDPTKDPRSRWALRIVGASLFILGLSWMAVALGLVFPWYALLPISVALVGEVLIVVSLIPHSEKRTGTT
jgi:hypothetical protein